MVQIRSNVFETNSSSMHSIALLKDKGKVTSLAEAMEEDPCMCVEDGVLKIKDEAALEFGWGFDIIDTAYGRLKYAIASLCYIPRDGMAHETAEGLGELLGEVRKIFPEIKAIELPHKDCEEEGVSCGYIDHESQGTLHSFLRRHGMGIPDYIADRNVLVLIDNDNSHHVRQIIYSGIFNEGAFSNFKDCSDEYDYDYTFE